MTDYTLVHYDEVPPQRLGHKEDKIDVRFYRDQLGMGGGGMTVMKMAPGITSVPHRHKRQEEVYLVIEGDVEIKMDDETLRLKKFDAVRVSKEANRSLKNGGKDPALVIGFGTPNTGPGDSINVDNFWQ
jgi:mannose-6-phosphate isomerase-like protein (cupin superfamily)